jgi:hypothetical protein
LLEGTTKDISNEPTFLSRNKNPDDDEFKNLGLVDNKSLEVVDFSDN